MAKSKTVDPNKTLICGTRYGNEIAEAVLSFFRTKLVVVSDFTLKKTNLAFSMEDLPQKDFFMWNKILDGFVKNADFGPQRIKFKSTKAENKQSADMKLIC